MAFSGGPDRSGYRQPVQARAFGTATLLVGMTVGALLFSIRWIAPPIPSVDAGQTAVFLAQSIPLAPVVEPTASPSPPRSPSKSPPPPATTDTSVPTPTAPISPAPISPAPAFQPQATGMATPVAGPAMPPGSAPATPASPTSSASAAADWRARLLGHLKRYRHYPRQAEAARQQGVARIAITLRRSGEVTAVELIHGSGFPLLDQEACATARRASPVPPVEDGIPGDPVTVEVPIDFALRR